MIKRYTCDNGVRIVLETIPTVRSVAIGVWVKIGSRNETIVNNGISHFIEHMLFKGTENRTAREIAESFDRIGGQVNAFTSKEYTCYYAKVLDTHSSYALEVLADMFFHSAFDGEEMEKEKNVVLEEIKMYEDTPDELVHDLLSQASYGNHPLGFPILGTNQTLDSFTPLQLKEYVHNMYTPENVVVSIAGNIDEEFIKEVESYFGKYQGGKNETPIITEVPDFLYGQLAKKKETEQAHLCLGYQGISMDSPDIYGLIILNNVLGGSMSSRLFQEVREQRGLAYSIYSYYSSYQDTGTVAIYGGTGINQLDTLYTTITETLQAFKAEGITSKELENSKEQLKGSLMLSLESTNSRMSRNGKNELLLGKHRTLDEIIESIDKVDIEMLSRLMNNIFTENCAMSLVSVEGKLPHTVHV